MRMTSSMQLISGTGFYNIPLVPSPHQHHPQLCISSSLLMHQRPWPQSKSWCNLIIGLIFYTQILSYTNRLTLPPSMDIKRVIASPKMVGTSFLAMRCMLLILFLGSTCHLIPSMWIAAFMSWSATRCTGCFLCHVEFKQGLFTPLTKGLRFIQIVIPPSILGQPKGTCWVFLRL